MTRIFLLLALFVTTGALSAQDFERPIQTGSELRDWCKSESEAQLIGQGLTPSNWTSRYWDEGNTLSAEGQWRTGEQRWSVTCRVAKGAQERFASINLSPG